MDKKRLWAILGLDAAIAGLVLFYWSGGVTREDPNSVNAFPDLAIVERGGLPEAAGTLDPVAASQLLAQARSCQAPLAYLSLWVEEGAPARTLSIQSGPYLSPTFKVTNAPQRVAIPFPAPYPTGKGTLVFRGDGAKVSAALVPAVKLGNPIQGDFAVNVIWKPGNPC